MCYIYIYMLLLEPVLPKVSMWTVLLKTSVINHMDVQCYSQWVSPDGGDIRRRNICWEVMVVNKKYISWWLCSYILKMHGENNIKSVRVTFIFRFECYSCFIVLLTIYDNTKPLINHVHGAKRLILALFGHGILNAVILEWDEITAMNCDKLVLKRLKHNNGLSSNFSHIHSAWHCNRFNFRDGRLKCPCALRTDQCVCIAE
jgi:hypothetical protein